MVNWSAITSPEDLLAIPNSNTGGAFWNLTLWLIWIVLFVATIFNSNVEVALLVASFFGIIAGLALASMGLIAWENVLMFVGMLIFTILYIVWSSHRD